MMITTRRLGVALLVALTFGTTATVGCGGGDTVQTAPEPGSADDPLKDAPKPARPAPEKSVADPAKK